jgi:hypothetical protein
MYRAENDFQTHTWELRLARCSARRSRSMALEEEPGVKDSSSGLCDMDFDISQDIMSWAGDGIVTEHVLLV